MLTKAIKKTNGRIIRNKEMPADFMALSSKFSPKFPKVMSDASNKAKGRARGTSVTVA